jgi:hypothetical protein
MCPATRFEWLLTKGEQGRATLSPGNHARSLLKRAEAAARFPAALVCPWRVAALNFSNAAVALGADGHAERPVKILSDGKRAQSRIMPENMLLERVEHVAVAVLVCSRSEGARNIRTKELEFQANEEESGLVSHQCSLLFASSRKKERR